MEEEEEGTYEVIKDIFTEYLKKSQHRKTPERYAILEKIYTYEGHFDAETLYNSMQGDYRVSLATVYNTLELLLDSHLIVKHQFGGQLSHYEKAFGCNTHNHLVCMHCGKVKEFSDKNILLAIQTKQFANFETSHYSLYLYGLCNKCRNELK